MKNENFNLVIVGTGGQGLITLLRILSQAALMENKDFKTAETHGLAQRGGAVEVHFRMGRNIFSSLVSQGGADLILALEAQESLRGIYYASEKTKFLINKYFLPIPGERSISEDKILNELKKFVQKHSAAGQAKNIDLIPANEICKKELGNEVLSGVYLISLAIHKKLIPLKPASISKAIKKTIPGKYLDLNTKALELARQNFLKEKFRRVNPVRSLAQKNF